MQATNQRAHKVLIVDDTESIVDLLQRWLTAAGYAVLTAGSGEAALAATARHQPDVVLLDLMIPHPNGFEVCQKLKRDQSTRRTAVILMSGLQPQENRVTGLDLGADDFLHKPLDRYDVMARVHSVIQGKGRATTE